VKEIIKIILTVFLLPLVLLADALKAPASLLKKAGYIILVIIAGGIFWGVCYRNTIRGGEIFLYQTGFLDKLSEVKTIGTSMLPTVKNGEAVSMHNPKKFGVEQGDLVSFNNIETGSKYYLKRVIGMPEEELALVNGYVTINGQALKEDYILKPGVTWGNTFLPDCEKYKIPKGKVAVMGDNRQASTDSRVIGFVDLDDIEGVIKKNNERQFIEVPKKKSQTDLTISPEKLAEELNKMRAEVNARPLRVNSKLNVIALNRAKMVAGNVLNWKNDGGKLTDTVDKSGYKYLLVQEMITFGQYTELELVEQIDNSAIYRADFASSQYYDLGVATAPANRGACGFPVVAIVIGWPTTPDYTSETINDWKKELEIVSGFLTIIKDLKNKPGFNNSEIDKLVTALTEQLLIAQTLFDRTQRNEWMTESDYASIADYNENLKEILPNLTAFFESNAQKFDAGTKERIDSLTTSVINMSDYLKKMEEVGQLMAAEDWAGMKKKAEEMLAISKTDDEKAAGNFWIGAAEYQNGQIVEATQHLLQATMLNPKFSEAYATLTEISLSQRNLTLGMTYAQKCIQLDGQNVTCHLGLGTIYLGMGRKAEGIKELEAAARLQPDSAEIKEILKKAKAI